MEETDERVLQEFAELQDQVLIQTDMHSKAMQQERILAVQRQRCVLTKQELSSMPDQTTMYKSIGRAYFCSPKADVLQELEAKTTQMEADTKKLREQRDVIDQKMRDTEGQIRELLKQSPALVRRLGAMQL